MAKATKLARNLVRGDRVWLMPEEALGWGEIDRLGDIFTVSRTERHVSGRGRRVLVYTEERGDRPVAWLRG